MNEKEITKQLIEFTIKNSNFEPSRNYVSLSHCSLPAEDLIAQFNGGFTADEKGRLKCYKGYQMQHDFVERMKKVFGNRVKTDIEVTAFNGMVKGHPDFTFDGLPGDFKSVLQDDWIPVDKLPYKVYCQMQGYMLYSNIGKALVIYESRESGLIKSWWINSNAKVQQLIDDKLKLVIQELSRL